MVMRIMKDSLDWRVRVNWLDAVAVAFGAVSVWASLFSDSLMLIYLAPFVLGYAVWMVWIKWKMRREHPLLVVFEGGGMGA